MPISSKSNSAAATGILYVVATPIGNLGDISARAKQVLADVDAIAAEDTRHTAQLLQHLGLSKPLVSLHEYNEAQRAQDLLTRLQRGENIALVSDAGTPLISDPGFDVVRAAAEANVRVVPVPGACAVIAALSAAGLATHRFAFEGFLPAKRAARREKLQYLARDERTLIFYEAPHRIAEMLADVASTCGAQRRVVVARELTKQFESFYRGTAVELAERANTDTDMQRGEIVVLIAGAEPASESTLDADTVLRVLLDELSPAQAAKLTAKLTGAKRADLYDRALAIKPKNGS